MVPKLPLVFLLAALAASPALGMQGKPNKKKKAAANPAAKVEFTLVVTGLTKENMSGVQETLGQLSVEDFQCPGCGTKKPEAGDCEACGTALEAHSQALFRNVTRGKGTLTFRLAPRAHASLSQIEKALSDGPARIQREKCDFGKKATLVYERAGGASSADDAADLEKAFHAAGVTGSEAALDPPSGKIHVQIKKGSLSWAQAARLGEAQAGKLRLADVVWGPMGSGKKG